MSSSAALPLAAPEKALDRALMSMRRATERFELSADPNAGHRTEPTWRELVIDEVREHGADIVALMPLVRESAARAEEGARQVMNMLSGDQLTKGAAWSARADLDRPRRTLGALMKAMHFFVRAFADSAYGAVIVLDGKKPGDYTSMNSALEAWRKRPVLDDRHHLPHHAFERHAPGFYAWFERMRDRRNELKAGDLAVGSEVHRAGEHEVPTVEITLEGKVATGEMERMTISEIEELVQWCTKIAQVVEIEADRQAAKFASQSGGGAPTG